MAADLALLFGQLDHEPTAPSEEERYVQVRGLTFVNAFSDIELREVIQASSWPAAESGTALLGQDTHAGAFISSSAAPQACA
jgi:hypothetical protein